MARWDSASSTVPVTPCGSNWKNRSPTIVIPDALLTLRHNARKASERVISGASAGQPYHSPSRWMPSTFFLPQRHGTKYCSPIKLLLLPKIGAWAIILAALQQRERHADRISRQPKLKPP